MVFIVACSIEYSVINFLTHQNGISMQSYRYNNSPVSNTSSENKMFT